LVLVISKEIAYIWSLCLADTQLICHTYIPEGGNMTKADYAGFVHECLAKLSDIDQQINMLDPEIHQDKIAYLREQTLEIQLLADRQLATI